MTLEETTQLYASVLRQLLPTGGYDTSPNTEALAVDVYAHAKLLAQADLDGKRLLKVLEELPPELLPEYELEYGLPLKCSINAGKTIEERIELLKWVRSTRNVLNRAYLEQLLAIFGVVLIDIVKFKPLFCTAPSDSPVNTEQLRYKVFLRLQYPVNADLNCIIENYLPGYLRFDWMIDMPWGNWILNSGVTINTNGIAHYTAYKTNQREYYDSYANLDLTTAIVRSLHDSDMRQWQAVTDAINTITGGVGIWEFMSDHVLWFNPAAWNDPSNQYYWTIDGKATTGQACYVTGQAACAQYAADNSWQSTWVQYNSCYGYDSQGRYSSAPGTLQNCTIKLSNPDCAIFGGSEANGVLNAFTNVKTCYTNSSQTSSLGAINRVVNPNYVPGTEAPTTVISFNTIAQKIILNASSSNQGIALFSEAYIEAVANSIFNADESKQFVKLSDLLSQFELNKTLRT